MRIYRHISWERALFWAIVAVGAGLRTSLIAGQRFHSDEAIYGYWAQLVASGQDPLLLSVPLDKPPLFIYLLAGIFKLFGPGEIAARLIGQAASLAAIALTYRLGRQFYKQPVALLAAALMALSPFNILFAPTAFTDPLMVALILGAVSLAAAGRWSLAGLAAGLAVATKQQGILFIPLVAAAGWLVSRKQTRARDMVRLGIGFAAPMLALTGWDALRWQMRASLWEQSAVSHGTLHLVPWWQLGQRLTDWSALLNYIFDSPVLNAILLFGVPLLLWSDLQAVKRDGNISARTDWLLAGFSAAFFLTHWLYSFNPWDRYLLGLVPLAALLLARIIWRGFSRAGAKKANLALVAITLLLTGPASKAAQENYPIGGDHGLYQGLENVNSFFRHEVPAGSVVWHRYLGWHYFHYLFDSELDLRWYADPAILLAKVQQESDNPNFIVFPAWEEQAEPQVRAALERTGLNLILERRIWRQDSSLAFTIYRIIMQ